MSTPNPFTTPGDPGRRPRPDPIEALSDGERERIKNEAASWGARKQASLRAAGFDSEPEFLASVGVTPELSATLEYLVAHLHRFVYFSSEEHAVAVALAVAHAHAVNACEQSPIVAFTSAVRRSGKSKALEVIAPICPRPWPAIRPSEAVFFRKIDRDQPTVFLDEFDTIFNARTEYEGIRAALNAGNRPGATVPRAVAKGKGFDLIDFKIYAAKFLAGIGDLPDTIRDRSIVIPMTRRGRGDRIERLRSRDATRLGRPIGDALARALANVEDLTLPNDDLPGELDDRAQDSWEPLLAIARLAGGIWPALARQAAIAISSDRSDVEDDSLGMILLRDVRVAFGDDRTLTTGQLIERLCAVELSPWGDIYGKPVSGRRLAKLLRPFGIRPERERAGSRYRWAQFTDAWSRYSPPETAATADTAPDEAVGVAPAALASVSRRGLSETSDEAEAARWAQPRVLIPRLVVETRP